MSVSKLQQTTGGAAAPKPEEESVIPDRNLDNSALAAYMPSGQVASTMNLGFAKRGTEEFKNWGDVTIQANQARQDKLASRMELYPDYATDPTVDANGNPVTDENGNPVDYWQTMDQQYGAGATDSKTMVDASNTQFESSLSAFSTLEASQTADELGSSSDYTGMNSAKNS